jgi:mandelate racemase
VRSIRRATSRACDEPMFERLTLKSIDARSVLVPLRRPVVSKVGLFDDWPLILIDLYTNEGVVGRSYLEPYLKSSARYIIPAIQDLAAAQAGKPLAPLDSFQTNRRSLNLIGYGGVAMIAVSGVDMAIWDALAKAADLPLAALLGGTVGPVPAYNSNGLWLVDISALPKEAEELVTEGGFKGLKLRLGRDHLGDDLAAIREVRKAPGDDIKLMVDFNQSLPLGDALHRCHALDDQGLYWFEEPITYDNQSGACDYVMPDLMRIGGVSGWLRAAPIAAAAGLQVSTHFYPEVAAHLMRVTETAHWLEWQDWAYPILKQPFAVKNGCLEIPNLPGTGIEWDEGVVERYSY